MNGLLDWQTIAQGKQDRTQRFVGITLFQMRILGQLADPSLRFVISRTENFQSLVAHKTSFTRISPLTSETVLHSSNSSRPQATSQTGAAFSTGGRLISISGSGRVWLRTGSI